MRRRPEGSTARRGSALMLLSALLLAGCTGPAHVATRASATPRAPSAPAPSGRVVPWQARHLGTPHAIEGWLSRVSVLPGEQVGLYVSTQAPSYRVNVFRMGWYDGGEGLLVWRSGALRGEVQAPRRLVRATRTASAPWHRSLTLDTRGYAPGDYLLRLDASSGQQRYVPLTVRSGSAAGKVVLLNAVTTWEAYNTWGGYNLYEGPAGFADRARVVSFDRPYSGDGAGQFTSRELPVVALAEKLHLPLEYATDVDLHADPGLLKGARAVITMGHDEYWSVQMRDAVVRARDAGTNVAFLGANAVYRRIRLADSPIGPNRLEIDYKHAAEDPLAGTGGEDVTSDWAAPPHPHPSVELVGSFYDCSRTPPTDMVVVDPGNWLFAGTGARHGTRWPGVVGTESDRAQRSPLEPRNLEVLTYSPFRCAGRPTWSDATYYTVPSGAAVFATGTITWVCVMGDVCSRYGGGDSSRMLTQVTTTLLRAFAAGPVGRVHPSVGNLDAVLP